MVKTLWLEIYDISFGVIISGVISEIITKLYCFMF